MSRERCIVPFCKRRNNLNTRLCLTHLASRNKDITELMVMRKQFKGKPKILMQMDYPYVKVIIQ